MIFVIALFEISAWALQPYFKKCVQIGQETAHLAPEETFPLLRAAGLEAEKMNLLRRDCPMNFKKDAAEKEIV